MKKTWRNPMNNIVHMSLVMVCILALSFNAHAVAIVPVDLSKTTQSVKAEKDQENTAINGESLKNDDKFANGHRPTKKEFRKMLKSSDPNLLPETNIEWFFLLVSGVGLFVAILGGLSGFGWLIFAGGLITYLFYKLLK